MVTFSGTPLKGQAPHSVTFVGTSDQTPVSVLWTFGDGGSDDTSWPSTVHTYTSRDKFHVTLTVRTGGDISCATTVTHNNYIQAQ
jgi:PKD repeat protein